MKPDTSKILKEALKLPPEARAALAGSLLESLEEPLDPDSETAWEAEIAARLKELDTSAAQLIPWSETRRNIADA
ncbi:MAG: addiction module component CHP02574 family protein [Candidatus Manganitrophaceae bacterium]|nr:MAG: addiction module component CHP02574 family protein [Candidatus Manganitrophaceae bacterium]